MNTLLKITVMSLTLSACANDKNIEVKYSGENLLNSYSITRDKETKAASFHATKDGAWLLYAGESVETIDVRKPIIKGTQAGDFSVPVNDSIRSYFFLKTDAGTAILAERHLPMTGGYNFRDLGGYVNKDGKHIKWGKVFRSDDLHSLTKADLFYLNHIPLLSIVDFRSPAEIAEAPDKVPAKATEYKLSISPGNLSESTVSDMGKLTSAELVQFMIDMNKAFSTEPAIIKQYKAFFALLQDETKIPLLFHCTAGKDRTGMGAALFLYALGVDEETIMNDYMASNIYLGDKFAAYTEKDPQLKPLFEVKKEYLQAGIDQIKQDHGSVENYLTTILDVDLAKMKQLYLFED